MEKKPVSKTLKIWFGVGDFMYNLCITFKTYYWTYFLTTVIALPLAVTGTMNTVINVFDFFMAFCWGAIIDSMKPMKWGRYRSMIVVIAPFIVLSHAAQWFAPTAYAFGWGAIPTAVLTIICFCLYIVFFNLGWVANAALIGVCASTEEDRAILSGTRNAWLSATGIFISYIAVFLIALFSSPIIGYAAAATILGVLTIPGYLAHFKLTEGYEMTRADMERMQISENQPKANRISFKEIIEVIKCNVQILWVILINSGTQLVFFVFAYMAVYLFEMSLERPDMYAFYLTAINIGAVLGSLLANILAKKYSIKKCVQAGLIIGIIAMTFAWRTSLSGNAVLFTAAMIIAQFSVAFVTPGIMAFYTNCAVYSEWKTGIDCTGTIIGLCGVPIKVALTIVGILVPGVLGAAGYVAGQPITESIKVALANAYSLIPIGLFVFSFILLTFLYKLTREKVDRYAAEIAERKSTSQ